jgi:hypothetical protein
LFVHAFEGENSFDLLKERKDVVTFETNFPDSIDVIQDCEDFFKNPTSFNMKCFPGLGDKVALIGDLSCYCAFMDKV